MNKNYRFIQAAQNGSVSGLRAALKEGADINYQCQNNRNKTALMIACDNGDYHMAKFLIQKGCNLELKEAFDGYSALMKAVIMGDLKMVTFLVDSGAKLNTQTGERQTVIHIAAHFEFTEILDVLLNKKIDQLEKKDYEGNTPLILASISNKSKSVAKLLDAGANIDAITKAGQTALMVAALHNCLDTAKLLLDRRSTIHQHYEDVDKALNLAKDNDMITLLNSFKE